MRDALGEVWLGDAHGELHVTVTIDDPAFYRKVAAQGSVGAGESYIQGEWHCDDLVALIRLLVRNRDLLDGMERGPARLGGWLLRGWNRLRRNSREGSRRNIAAHYDLGNDFFALFLSPDLMYSSALFDKEDESLESASRRKLDRICQQLKLKPGDRVVEIGTGWGGLRCTPRSTTAATSPPPPSPQNSMRWRQSACAPQPARPGHAADAGLPRPAGASSTSWCRSMIEAIGAEYLDTYMATLQRLLKPDGVALLQAITIEDHRYEQARRSVDYIKRYVFPGSFIPSINAIMAQNAVQRPAADRPAGLRPLYALTLRAWRQRFLVRLPDVQAQGFDTRFCRLWEFYLAYCEGGFLERSIGVSHLLMARPGIARAPHRARAVEMRRFWANLLGNQLVWLCAVAGAGRGWQWPALLAASLYIGDQLLTSPQPRLDLRLMVLALACAWLVDASAAATGTVRYAAPARLGASAVDHGAVGPRSR